MIASLLSVTLAFAGPADEGNDTIRNRRFDVTGWRCGGEGCRSTPRRLGPRLRFDPILSRAGFDHVKKLDQNWHVVLDCTVTRDRVMDCRAADPPAASIEARAIALELAQYFRVRTVDADDVSDMPRALIGIHYETGDCPSWMCSIVPPAPPPIIVR